MTVMVFLIQILISPGIIGTLINMSVLGILITFFTRLAISLKLIPCSKIKQEWETFKTDWSVVKKQKFRSTKDFFKFVSTTIVSGVRIILKILSNGEDIATVVNTF